MMNIHRVLWLAVLVFVCLGAISVWRPDGRPAPRSAAWQADPIYATPVERVETRVLERGETLSGVLGRARIDGAELANLLLALREYADPRRLAAGIEVTVRRWIEGGDTRAVELRMGPDTTVRLEHSSTGWDAEIALTPTVVDTLALTGTVEPGRTLYEALVHNPHTDLPPSELAALVVELADIYAYTIDFAHDIRPGDSFRLVYEREVRPDGSTRSRRILITEIQNRNARFPAVYFEIEGRGGGYYDLEGESLRRAFLRSPLDYVRVTSSFSWRRYHPITGEYRAHLGTDFGARMGTPVHATGDGTVVFAGWNGGYGNFIRIRHPRGYTTAYAHMSAFADSIHVGYKVKQGEVIGYVGSTGLSTGPHLHYEFRRYGEPKDSRTVELPGEPPVPDSLEAEYREVVRERRTLLERMTRPRRPVVAAGVGKWIGAGGGR